MNRVSIGADNGLSSGRRQAIILTNAGILSIGPLGTNSSEIFVKNRTFPLKKMRLKMSSVKWRLFCPGEDELTLIKIMASCMSLIVTPFLRAFLRKRCYLTSIEIPITKIKQCYMLQPRTYSLTLFTSKLNGTCHAVVINILLGWLSRCPSSTKSLPEPMLTNISDNIWRRKTTMS